MIEARWVKHPDGRWMVCTPAGVQPGEVVEVVSQAGKRQAVQLGKSWQSADGQLWWTHIPVPVAAAAPAAAGRPPSCPYCGAPSQPPAAKGGPNV